MGLAEPRVPLPPWPESGVLYAESFDQPYQMAPGQAIDSSVWVESWSGYALNRSSQQPVVAPWVVPMMATNGSWNIDAQQGALRLWYQPDGGLGSGNQATLLTLVSTAPGNDGAAWWNLTISADGGSVLLTCASANGPGLCLSAPVAFQTGNWSLVTLAYSATNSALFINDQQVATGSGLPTVPAQLAPSTALVLGSTLGGDLVACGQIEEFTALTSRPEHRHEPVFDPTDSVVQYYAAYSGQAALGPISDAELAAADQARAQRLAANRAEMALLPLNASPADGLVPLDASSGCCGTNWIYDVWLTNTVVWPGAAGGWTTALSIGGGTNGALYDVYRTTAILGGSITNFPWVWLTNAYACDTVVLTNEPDTAFYILGTPLDSDGDGIPDAYAALIHDGLGPDSNGNGVPDWLEAAMGFDPRQTNNLGKSQPGYSLFLAEPQSGAQLP